MGGPAINNEQKNAPPHQDKAPKNGGLSVWHWGSESKPYGINNVVLDEGRSRETIARYTRDSVNRVYGGYSKIPAHPLQKTDLAAWNSRLFQSGIHSIYLIGNPQWIYATNRQSMIEYISAHYIGFNKSVPNDSQFRGLHLDIEPHQLDEWRSASPGRKRELLIMLSDTFMDIRLLLIRNGMEEDEIMADIPTWFDDSDIIGWGSESEKRNWFRGLSESLSGLTIMAYEVQSIPTIVERTKWERDNFKGMVQIGLDAGEIGSIWPDGTAFFNALRDIRQRADVPVALHNYTSMLQAK